MINKKNHPMKKTILLFFVLCSTVLFAQSNKDRALQMIRGELRPIIQTALDLAELQPYFHAKNNILEKAVVFEEEDPYTPKNLKGLAKFSKPVSVLKKSEIARLKIKKYFSLNDWEISMDNCRLVLNFNGEGLLITYQLKKIENKWIILSYKITEKK